MTDNRQAGWVDGLGVKRERARRECPHNFGNLQHCGFLKVASQSWPIGGVGGLGGWTLESSGEFAPFSVGPMSAVDLRRLVSQSGKG